jgi:two-component system sensor histidine kinase/response regulator
VRRVYAKAGLGVAASVCAILLVAGTMTMRIGAESRVTAARQLEGTLDSLLELLDATYQRRIEQITVMSTAAPVLAQTRVLLTDPGDEAAHEALREAMSMVLGKNGIDGYLVVDEQNLVVAAWDPALRGVTTQFNEELARRLDRDGWAIVAPFRAGARSTGAQARGEEEYVDAICARLRIPPQPRARLCLRAKANALFGLLRGGWQGASGEAYLIDRDGRLRTPSRFDAEFSGDPHALDALQATRLHARVPSGSADAAGRLPLPQAGNPLTRVAQTLLLDAHSRTGYLERYPDYRGRMVDGVGAWYAPMDLALVVEVDHDELHATAEMAIRSLWLLALASALLLGALGWARTRARVELANSEARLSSFFQNAPVSMHIQDRAGRYVQVNPVYERQVGMSAAQMIGKTDADLPFPDPQSTAIRQREHHEVLEANTTLGSERRYVDARGVEHDAWVVRFPIAIRPGAAPSSVGTVCVDATEAVEARQALQQLTQHLEAEIAERTRDLERARDAAEEASRSKADFLANMSHEIRTPLNAITGMSHLASRLNQDSRIAHYLRQIVASGDHLLGIVNEILDFSRIESGKVLLDPVKFSPERLLLDVSELVGPRASAKRLELMLLVAPEVPAVAVGDAKRIAQVLINFAGNAVKFTESGQVQLRAQCLQVEGRRARLRFEVEDTGVGIAAAQLPLLFQPFRQLDSGRSRSHEGSGLGLAISQRLAQLMGGQVSVQSNLGFGSCFSLEVDVDVVESAPRNGPRLPPGTRALVVDDHPAAGRALVELLLQAGAGAELADSGDAAIDLIAARDAQSADSGFTLVFVAERLARVRGGSVGQLIGMLDLAHGRPLRVLLLPTGQPEPAESGFDQILRKPVTRAALTGLTRRQIEEERTQVACVPRPGDWASLAGLRALLVEDNRVNQEVACDLLELVGIRVTVASEGAEALRLLHASEFDVVLMDIHMPTLDGIETTCAIRRDPALAGLPVIGLSASALVAERERCIEAGMNDFVAKPIVPQVLYASIDRCARRPPAGSPAVASPSAPNTADLALLQALRQVEGLDVERGLGYFMGRGELYCALVRRAVGPRGVRIDGLEQMYAERQMSAAARLLHDFGSAAGSLGAEALRQQCRALEDLMQRGVAAPAQVAAFAAEARRLLHSLEDALDRAGAQAHAAS